jgi:uncharacterized protein (TIGR03118 family)
MRTWFRNLRHALRAKRPARQSVARPNLEVLEHRWLPSSGPGFVETNLASDIQGFALNTNAAVINPWGITETTSGSFLIADNGTGMASPLAANGTSAGANIVIPPPAGSPAGTTSAPTGQVANTTNDFVITEGTHSAPATNLFATEDGTIAGFNSTVDAANAILAVDLSASGAVFKGLAQGSAGGANFLYATDFHNGTIDVFDTHFTAHSFGGSQFTDPHPVAGFAPFGIQNVNGVLFVTYAKQDTARHDDVAGAGNGYIDEFDTSGHFIARFASGTAAGGKLTALNSPWGMVVAPPGFGNVTGDLLVGNFGDSHVSAFNLKNGHFVDQLRDANGQPLVLDGGFNGPDTKGLWGMAFGNGQGGAGARTLFFTSGINDEGDGLFGSVQSAPTLRPNAPLLPSLPGAVMQSFSTATASGEGNPYGVAFVPSDFAGHGILQPGDLLVSNFNSGSGTQGTGTTIQRITPSGATSTFFTSTLPGLDTALGVLKAGFVIVGNLPNVGGTIGQGALQILDANGHVVLTLTDSQLLDGPWDLTINDEGNDAQVFVSNVLSGTVTRVDIEIGSNGLPKVVGETQIASGYAHHTDPNALVVGPTGLAFDEASATLYVASTADNEIFAIAHAADTRRDRGTGKLVVQDNTHLHGPLGLVLAPNGDLIAANGDAVNPGGTPNDLVEYTRKGKFVGDFQVDPGAVGAAFGIALSTDDGKLRFAAVDDNTNSVEIFTFSLGQAAQKHHHHFGGEDDSDD